MENLLEIRHLNVYYYDKQNMFSKPEKKQVIFDMSFDVKKSEIFGIVGESGCGKSTLSKAILGINKLYDGEIIHHSKLPQMVFQDPYSSLNPAWTVERILKEPLLLRGIKDKKVLDDRVEEMLELVELSKEYAKRKPSELSGGQRQRISIAAALIGLPELVIADEPLSALDVTVQAQVMELILKLQKKLKITFILISHDIDVIYQMCDRILVLKEGRAVEIGETEELFKAPKEEYTKKLINF